MTVPESDSNASMGGPFLPPDDVGTVIKQSYYRTMQQDFPFKKCAVCMKRRTSWVIMYGLSGRWIRICPNCMSDDERKQMTTLLQARTRSKLKVKY